jgi:outer membrane lipoprotein carrier protein
MKNPFRIGTHCFGVAILILPAASGVEDIVARFQERLRNMNDLRARFTQTFHSETLGSTPAEEGTLYVKFPGRMRWEYSKPKDKIAVLDGEKTYVYLPEEGRVIVGRLDDLLQESPAALLLVGELRIEEEFLVERVPEARDLAKGMERLRLIPRKPNARFDFLMIDLDQGGERIRAIHMEDPLGNRVEYQFRHIRENLSLTDDLFRFEPPEGVEVQWSEGR